LAVLLILLCQLTAQASANEVEKYSLAVTLLSSYREAVNSEEAQCEVKTHCKISIDVKTSNFGHFPLEIDAFVQNDQVAFKFKASDRLLYAGRSQYGAAHEIYTAPLTYRGRLQGHIIELFNNAVDPAQRTLKNSLVAKQRDDFVTTIKVSLKPEM
jgi:hypothetical protein